MIIAGEHISTGGREDQVSRVVAHHDLVLLHDVTPVRIKEHATDRSRNQRGELQMSHRLGNHRVEVVWVTSQGDEVVDPVAEPGFISSLGNLKSLNDVTTKK
jgi:hypothetical protein